MKIILVALIILLAKGVNAGDISVTVKGMVCSFCVQGIEKKLKKNPAVESLKVDLDKNLVSIKTKENQDLDDDQIKTIINDAGYSVDKIER